METIDAILFEPVGCLAEFPVEPFQEIAALFHRRRQPAKSASRYYWHLLNLMESSRASLPDSIELLEAQAVDHASLYEDVRPALGELKAMGLELVIASSLCGAAIAEFLEVNQLEDFFIHVWSRDNAGGVKAAPMKSALGSIKAERAIYLTDTAEGLNVSKNLGINAVLMMNDPDEARKLALRGPSGGIVSLHELPDFVRLLALRALNGAAARRSRHPNTD